MNFKTAVIGRIGLLLNYARRSPSLRQLGPWLLAGLVKARMVSGIKVGMLRPALDRCGGKRLILDATSQGEMDVFHEVVVGRNYPFELLPFTPVMVADCGANIGFFACLSRVTFPESRIVAWEPDEHNFKRLGQQPLLRGDNTILTHAAVSDHEGRVVLSGSGHGCEIAGEAVRGEGEGVACIDFGAWWRQHAVPGTLLKMDIEGHETSILPHLRGNWKAPCAVFLETHAAGGRDEVTIGQLRDAGFEVHCLRTHSLPDDRRIFKEYFAILSGR